MSGYPKDLKRERKAWCGVTHGVNFATTTRQSTHCTYITVPIELVTLFSLIGNNYVVNELLKTAHIRPNVLSEGHQTRGD